MRWTAGQSAGSIGSTRTAGRPGTAASSHRAARAIGVLRPLREFDPEASSLAFLDDDGPLPDRPPRSISLGGDLEIDRPTTDLARILETPIETDTEAHVAAIAGADGVARSVRGQHDRRRVGPSVW